VFVTKTQPGLMDGFTDWVSDWSATGDELDMELNEDKPTAVGDEQTNARLSGQINGENLRNANEMIFQQRLWLYNFVVDEFC
jgi:hypothetical protein